MSMRPADVSASRHGSEAQMRRVGRTPAGLARPCISAGSSRWRGAAVGKHPYASRRVDSRPARAAPAQLRLCGCLLASILLLPAAEGDGGVAWAGGRLSLKEAVDLLDGSGNPTRLLPGADSARQVMLPAFRSSYWQAALLIARSFDLELRPPPRSANPGHDADLRGQAIAWSSISTT